MKLEKQEILMFDWWRRYWESLDERQIRVMAVVFLAYFLTARIGLGLQSVNTFATLIWAPAGIALAVFLIYGYRPWPAVALAAFAANLSVGAPIIAGLGIAVGNTAATLAGAFFIKWYGDYKPGVLRLQNNIALAMSAILVPLISATVGVGSLSIAGVIPLTAFGITWGTWWMGDALGIIICTPFLLKWLNQPLYERAMLQKIELGLALGAVALVSFWIFWSPRAFYAYYLFIPLTWAALRTGPRGTTLAVLLASILGITGTLFGHGLFVERGLFDLQIFLGSIGTVFLIFAAVVQERRQALLSLERHVSELETSIHKISSEDEAKKEFIAALAHELRNPLATILSSIELLHLRGGPKTPEEALPLNTIQERSRAMVHLLDDLLDISRISQKKLMLKKSIVDIDRFIDHLVQTVQPLIRRYGHTLSVTKSSEALYLEADPVRLEQIFINLLSNAAKYTKQSGLISVSVERQEKMEVIRVRDNGIGISRNMLKRVFEPFFQVNDKQVSTEGIGIGLPLTRQLIEMHGGTIEVKSAGVDEGSEFIVRLPLVKLARRAKQKQEAQALTGVSVPSRAPRALPSFKILVVDDNKDAADALARLLQLRGHDTTVAYNGEDAVHEASRLGPDIVFLDIGLPDISGYEVIKKLRDDPRSYYVIALTGYGQAEDKERAKKEGFYAHLTKPAGLKEIEAVLRRVARTMQKIETYAPPASSAQAVPDAANSL